MTRPAAVETCFFEANPALSLVRRSLTEGVGTLFLMFVVTASGSILLNRMPDTPGLALLVGSLAGPGALVALVLAFGAVSGGHFNPLITALQWLGGERTSRCTLAYIACQLAGSAAGAKLAIAAYDLPSKVTQSINHWAWMPTETVASAGLMMVVLGCTRSGRAETGPFAVGAWLVAVSLSVPHAFVNPALTIGAWAATSPDALTGLGVLIDVPAQCVGALISFFVIRAAYVAVPDRQARETP